jgi:hypothetical protein
MGGSRFGVGAADSSGRGFVDVVTGFGAFAAAGGDGSFAHPRMRNGRSSARQNRTRGGDAGKGPRLTVSMMPQRIGVRRHQPGRKTVTIVNIYGGA